MNKPLSILLLACFAAFAFPQARAQVSQPAFNPGAANLEWKHLSTDHFDIHFYAGDPVLAGSAARYAEEALWGASRLLDYKPRSRYQIWLYLAPTDYVQSNQYPDKIILGGGITELPANSEIVIYDGSALHLHQQVGAKASRMLMDEFFYGGSILNAIQNATLLYEPQWFAEGLPALLGEGWGIEDEMWISSLANEALLDFAIEGDGPIYHTVRKSIWYFIMQQYGTDKLHEVFQMTRLHRSAEEGVERVLGLSLKTLTERWREFLLQRITENGEARESLDDKASRVQFGKGERLIGMAQNPVKPLAAFCLEKKGIQRVVIYDLESGTLTETGIRGGFITDQFIPFPSRNPMAWSADGKHLACVYFNGAEENLAWFDQTAGTYKSAPVRPALDRIYEIAWNHEGTQVAVSGLRTGSVDLFSTIPGGTQFIQLTDDLYDDRCPVWSLDDQQLFFASNRPQPADSIVDFPYHSWTFTQDVYRITFPPAGNEVPVQVTFTPEFSERPVTAPTSFEIIYLTDEAGIPNLKKQNVFLGDSVFVTNVATGIKEASLSETRVLFTAPWRGQLAAYTAAPADFYTEGTVLNTRLRHFMHLERLMLERARKERAMKSIDSLNQVKVTPPQPPQVKVDSARSDSSRKLKYYVFDEEDADSRESERRRKTQRATQQTRTKKEPPAPDFASIVAKGPTTTGAGWTADRLVTRLGFDPVFKLNLGVETHLKDLRGDQRLVIGYRPYLNMRNGDFFANYSFLKHKVDLHAGIERSSRYIDRNEYFFRYNTMGARAGASLPLTRFTALSGGLRYNYLRRYHLDPFSTNPLNGAAHMASASVSLMHDSRSFSGNWVRKGAYLEVNAREAFALTGMEQNFLSFTLDARKYLRMGRHMVLAGRIAGGVSFGPAPQQFFLGGADEWLLARFASAADFPMNQNIGAYHFMEYVTPVRGFNFNARNGTKYVALNAELRIPVYRMMINSLNSRQPYNLELIPFCDFGTAWREGNPLSQRNPISTTIIDEYPLYIEVQTLRSPFVMGFGSGFRFTMFSYSMRCDLAWGVEDYTLQKPLLHLTLGKNF